MDPRPREYRRARVLQCQPRPRDAYERFAESRSRARPQRLASDGGLRTYLVTQLNGPRCSDSVMEPLTAPAFNGELEKIGADLDVKPIDARTLRPSKMLPPANLGLYWQTPESRRLHEQWLQLRGRGTALVPMATRIAPGATGGAVPHRGRAVDGRARGRTRLRLSERRAADRTHRDRAAEPGAVARAAARSWSSCGTRTGTQPALAVVRAAESVARLGARLRSPRAARRARGITSPGAVAVCAAREDPGIEESRNQVNGSLGNG